MRKAPELRAIFEPPEEIIEAGLNGDLVLFVGAGASMLVGLPSWSELAEKVLGDLREADFLDYSEIEQLKTLDAKKQLSIAYLIAEENNFEINIQQHLSPSRDEEDGIYKALNDIGCSCITTNYDELLSPRYTESKDGSETPVIINRVFECNDFFANLLNRPGTVVHLHGSVSNRNSMVITTKQYLEHYDHRNVQEFLGELFAKKVVLFLGYGLDEAEVLEHILRRGRINRTKERKRFVLQGYYRSQMPLYKNMHRYYESSFGVHLLGFERDKENYHGLERLVKSWVSQIEIRKPPLVTDLEFMDEVLGSE